jgi:hypothetical protein
MFDHFSTVFSFFCRFVESRGHVLHGTRLLRQQVRTQNRTQTSGAAQGHRLPQTTRSVPPLRQRLHLRHAPGKFIRFICIRVDVHWVLIRQAHHSKCGRLPIVCPNQCESPKVVREELESHLKDHCPALMVSCPFKEAGCRYKVSPRSIF